MPLKNVESPYYGGGVSTLLGAAGDPPPVMFPVVPVLFLLMMDLSWVLGSLQSCGSIRPLQGILLNKIILVLHRTGIGRWTYMSYLTALHILLWKGALLAQKLKNHLRCWFLIMLTPLASIAVIQNTTSLLEHPLAQPEPSLGGRLVESISDGEPAARQVPDTTLDSRLKEGNTYLEHPALGVSLDSGPMEGMSCLEPLEQAIIQSSWIARPRKCVMKKRSEWKPVINPASSYTLDSRPMEGITYLERSALGESLDSGPKEGTPCLELYVTAPRSTAPPCGSASRGGIA